MNRKKISTVVLGMVAGAIMTLIIGFSSGFWSSTAGSVQKGNEMAKQAVIERLTPICFSQFNLDSNRDQKLIELKKTNSWNRADYVSEQGWATMPFEKEFDIGVAEKCAIFIFEHN
jgi:hypothetical protein